MTALDVRRAAERIRHLVRDLQDLDRELEALAPHAPGVSGELVDAVRAALVKLGAQPGVRCSIPSCGYYDPSPDAPVCPSCDEPHAN